MESLNDWLQPQYIWIVVGFVLILMEFATPGLITIFFGIGAVLVGILCWFIDMSVNFQLIIFLVSSVILLTSLRNSFKKLFGEKLSYENMESEDEFIGKRAVVTQKISANNAGRVEFRGTSWEAEAGTTIPEGKTVKIIDKKNITLIVEQI